MTTYSFVKTPVDIPRLTQEVQTSSIVTALDHINLFGTALDLIFKADLSTNDQTALSTIVTNHTGQPLLSNIPQSVTVLSQPSVTIQSQPAPAPFAAKVIGTKKLYKRVSGLQAAVVTGSTDIFFTVPYPWCKITGLEIIGAELLDKISLYVLDSVTGAYSGTASTILNQFGFTVNPAKDYYNHSSEYDADLYQGMQVRVAYVSISAKTIGINFIMNEVK